MGKGWRGGWRRERLIAVVPGSRGGRRGLDMQPGGHIEFVQKMRWWTDWSRKDGDRRWVGGLWERGRATVKSWCGAQTTDHHRFQVIVVSDAQRSWDTHPARSDALVDIASGLGERQAADGHASEPPRLT